MARVYALMEFIDAAGDKHEVDGEPIDLPRNTDEEKRIYDRLIEYGVVSTTEPKIDKPKPDEGEPDQRTRRARS